MAGDARRGAFWRGAVVGMIACVGLAVAWHVSRPAVAQTPQRKGPTIVGSFDAGRQRNTMIKELQRINKQLEQTNKLLRELRDGQQKLTPERSGG